MTRPGIEFRSVSKAHGGRTALCGVSFAFAGGQHVAILGPSGCGKTTALRLLAGLDAPCAGQVLLNGSVVSEANRILTPPHRRRVSMVFQDLALWPNLSAAENVVLGLSGGGLSKRDARTRGQEALAACGIASLADRKPGELSGGQQQRVALARAVAPRPAFLLLDEPFQGLDLVTKGRLLDHIRWLAQEQGFMIVLVTHDPMELMGFCRSAVVLHEGRVEEAGVLADLLRDPQSEILKAFRNHSRGLASAARPKTRPLAPEE